MPFNINPVICARADGSEGTVTEGVVLTW